MHKLSPVPVTPLKKSCGRPAGFFLYSIMLMLALPDILECILPILAVISLTSSYV